MFCGLRAPHENGTLRAYFGPMIASRTLVAGTFCLIFGASAYSQVTVTAWTALKEGLSSGKPEVRAQALAAVASIGDVPEAVKLEENGLHDKSSDVRQMAAMQLGAMKAHDAIPALRGALDDPSPEVVFTAAKSLWDLGDPEATEILQEVVTGDRKDAPSALKKQIRKAKKKMTNPTELAFMGAKEATGAFLGPASMGISVAEMAVKKGDGNPVPGRSVAADLLSENCDARSLQLLEWSLNTDDSHVVRAADAKAIGRCGNKASIPTLQAHLEDKHDVVRFMSAAAVIRLDTSGMSAAEFNAREAERAARLKPQMNTDESSGTADREVPAQQSTPTPASSDEHVSEP